MAIAYNKDITTGIVAVDSETVIDRAALHDSFTRFFVPDGKYFRVPFEVSDDVVEWKQIGIAASGVTKAGRDTLYPVRIKVRIEPASDEPKDPAIAEKAII